MNLKQVFGLSGGIRINGAGIPSLSSPPASPTGLTATPSSTSQIDLAWTDNASDETAYRVYRSTDGVSYSQIGSDLPAGATSYNDTSIVSGQRYYYKVGAVGAGGVGYSSAVQTNTLLYGLLPSYWKLEESSGVRDDWAGSNDLTPTGTSMPGSAAGIQGYGVEFVAAQKHRLMIVSNPTLILGGTDHTICGWVKFATITTTQYLLAKWNAGVTPNNEWGLYKAANSTMRFVTRNAANGANATVVDSNYGNIPAGEWLFVIVEYNKAADKTSISINNGTPVQSSVIGGIYSGTNSMWMGGDTGENFFVNGVMDEWEIRDRLLTATEKAAKYNGGSGNTPPFDVALNPLVVAFGDSITSGVGASSTSKRWTTKVAAAKGWRLINSGISGTTLQNTIQNLEAVIGGALVNNGRDTYASRITAYKPVHLLIMYGTNDLRFNDVNFTSAVYASELGEIVDTCIDDGVSAQNIIICTPPHIVDYSYGAPNWGAGSVEKLIDYGVKCLDVATSRGTKFVDTRQYMVDNGGDALIGPDGLHPNDDGNEAIYEAVMTVA